jgi:ribosomal protein L11 methyltransferase
VAPRSGPAADDWIEIAVEVAGIDSELAADVFRQGCPGGVAIQPAHKPHPTGDGFLVDGDAPALVKGYLQPGSDSVRIRRSLRLALQAAPLDRPPRWRRARRLREQDWRHSWKQYFRPQRVGRSLVVKPSWSRFALRDGDTVIEIDPGMAFGTGQHPTTAMCLRALEDSVRSGMNILDLGTGSGILAIAAAKLGAARVLALDVDPMAVKAARQNAIANEVAHRIDIREGTLDDSFAPDLAFDIIVANIGSVTIERLAPTISHALALGGTLIVSGFLEDAVRDLTRAFHAAGLSGDRVIDDGVWCCIVTGAPAQA